MLLGTCIIPIPRVRNLKMLKPAAHVEYDSAEKAIETWFHFAVQTLSS